MKLDMGMRRGPMYLERDPQVPSEAATKAYVDNTVNAHATDTALHLSQSQKDMLDSLNVGGGELNYLAGLTSNVQDQLDAKLNKSGGTMTGPLTLDADPVETLEAATKGYVDTGLNAKFDKAGGTLTGFMTLHAAPTNNFHPATKQYVDSGLSSHTSNTDLHLSAGERAWISAVVPGVTATEVNYLAGVTSGVQTQLDAKLDKSGGTMTGFITLHGAPTDNLHPATKQYTDTGLNTKFDKAGGSLTGFATLHADPTANMHAVTKQYADAGLSTHAGDDSLHLTSGQNAFLDAVTASATEVNQLVGVTSGVQAQLDAKFDKAGGTVTGDVTVADGYGIFVSKVATAGTELVNKAYVDSAVQGQRWETPVLGVNLVSAALSAPPVSPVEKDVYIVGAAATGAWAGLEGRALAYNGTGWDDILGRAVAAGDRFGVGFGTATATGEDLSAHNKRIVILGAATPGDYGWTAEAVQLSSTTLVFNALAPMFGVTFTHNAVGNWEPTNTSVNLVAGAGLDLNGNTLVTLLGHGLMFGLSEEIQLKLKAGSALSVSTDGLELLLDGNTLTSSGSGIKLSDSLLALINDALQKSGTNTVSGSITVTGAGALLRYTNAPLIGDDVTNKTYVDNATGTLTDALDAVSDIVDVLNTDPTTKTYVDDGLALKVNKAGDTLTGFLVLHADPSSAMHPVTKQYSDSALNTHATDTDLHLSEAERDWLTDTVPFVTAIQLNYLSTLESNAQDQLDSKVAKAGDTLTGPLVLHAAPATAMTAANKGYVDDGLALKVNKAGDTLTGFLVLHADPSAAMHPTTKQYVDSGLSTHATNADLHLTTGQNAFLDAVTASATEVNYLTGVTSAVQEQLGSKLDKAGGTMTGFITLHADPETNLQAATKGYVDTGLNAKFDKAGGTLTGFMTLHAAPTDNLHASTKKYVDDQITALSESVNGDVTDKVSKAGDTMTGLLILSGDPVASLGAATMQFVETQVDTAREALETTIGTIQTNVSTLRGDVDGLLVDPVTKTYVDNQDNLRLSKAGGTMTGYVTLHADPLNAMHPATKQYVDTVAQGLIAKPSVRLATTDALDATYVNGTSGVNATLTGNENGPLTVDGKLVSVNDRILVRMQFPALENGDYTVQQVGDGSTPFILKRVVTADESSEIPRSYFYVFDGVTLKGTGWTFSVSNPITFTVGTDAINVNQFSGQGSLIAGNGLTISGNTIQVNSANSERIVVNADDIDLATTGVTPGNYTKVTIDGYGRATGGSNPTTLAGYGIADAQALNPYLTNISAFTGGGLMVVDAANEVAALRLLAYTGSGLTINDDGAGNAGSAITFTLASGSTNTGNTLVFRDENGNFAANEVTAALKGNADTATALATSRDFSIDSVDMSAPAIGFTGAGNVVLAPLLTETGVTAGSYFQVEVDSKGRVVDGNNPTTAGGFGITDVYTKAEVDALLAASEAKFTELYNYVISRM